MNSTSIAVCGAVLVAAAVSAAHANDGPQYVTKQLPPATIFHGSRNRDATPTINRAPISRGQSIAPGNQSQLGRVQMPGQVANQQSTPPNAAAKPMTRVVFDQFGRAYVIQLDPKLDPFRRPDDPNDKQNDKPQPDQPKPKTPQELARERAVQQSQQFFSDLYGSRRSAYNQSQQNYSTHNINRDNQNQSGYSPSDYSYHNQRFTPSFHNQNTFNQTQQGYNFHLQSNTPNASHLFR